MAYITVAEVKEIRKELKATFGKKFKFSVTRRDRGLAVTVAIMSGKADLSNLWDGKSPEDYGYGYTSVNQYYINEENYGKMAKTFQKIDDIIRKAPAKAEGGQAYFDDSDSMTDYFHCAFYYDIQVGKYDRPYQKVA